MGDALSQYAAMSLRDFKVYLATQYVSPTTGAPLGAGASGDYLSRLRRIERLTGRRVEGESPDSLRTLADQLGDDRTVADTLGPKGVAGTRVALRRYADYLSLSDRSRSGVPPGRAPGARQKASHPWMEPLRSSVGITPLFSWIHLSDIHVGHGDATHVEDQKLVLGALRRDVEHRLASGTPRPDAIFVTGDIAFSGACRTPDEYTRAAQWLTDIARCAGLGLDSVFVVPGNHDVQRPADRPVTARTLLRQLRKGEPSLDEALADSAALAQLRARQANYLAFAEGFAPACRTDAESPGAQLYWRHTLEAYGGLRIRIVGLNTALLAADEAVFESDQRRLWLGTRQLSAAFTEPEVAPGEVVIVLSHHPLRDHWLADETDAGRWIRRHAHLHLSGHVHEGASERAGSGGGTALVSIAAGAVHGEKTPHGYPARHGYSFGALVAKDGTLKVRVRPQMWSDANKDFRLDVDNVPRDETYAEHDLHRVRVPAGVKAEAAPEAPAIDCGHKPVPREASHEEPRKVRLTVHRAFFVESGQECFFINATNLSRTREVELTHLWLQLHSDTPVLQADRPLPKRLKPDESWETWFRVDAVPEQFHDSIYTLARARLSSGQLVSSEKNEGVPEAGAVPGGPIRLQQP